MNFPATVKLQHVCLCGVCFSGVDDVGASNVLNPPIALALNHANDVLDMPVDPNEPTYCLCHQVSYGEMIGCDNPDVRSILLMLFCRLICF